MTGRQGRQAGGQFGGDWTGNLAGWGPVLSKCPREMLPVPPSSSVDSSPSPSVAFPPYSPLVSCLSHFLFCFLSLPLPLLLLSLPLPLLLSESPSLSIAYSLFLSMEEN